MSDQELLPCSKCGENKPEGAFGRRTGRPRGRASQCKACISAFNKEQYKDPDKRSAKLARSRKYYGKHAPRLLRAARSRFLKELYGLTQEAFDAMLAAQGGGCAVCKEPRADGRSMNVDHDHKSGIVRGLLCFRCNRGIGLFRDDPARLTAAATYLMKEPL